MSSKVNEPELEKVVSFVLHLNPSELKNLCHQFNLSIIGTQITLQSRLISYFTLNPDSICSLPYVLCPSELSNCNVTSSNAFDDDSNESLVNQTAVGNLDCISLSLQKLVITENPPTVPVSSNPYVSSSLVPSTFSCPLNSIPVCNPCDPSQSYPSSNNNPTFENHSSSSSQPNNSLVSSLVPSCSQSSILNNTNTVPKALYQLAEVLQTRVSEIAKIPSLLSLPTSLILAEACERRNIVFYGKPKENIVEFLEKFHKTAISYSGTTDDVIAHGLTFVLKDKARTFYELHEEKFNSWSEAKDALLKNFRSRYSDHYVEVALMSKPQQPNEPLMNFVTTFIRLNKYHSCPLSEEALVDKILYNLCPHFFKIAIKRQIKSIEELSIIEKEYNEERERIVMLPHLDRIADLISSQNPID